MRIVCYYTNWSVYRPGQAKFSPQNINPYLCTHLVYAFGGFTKENTLKPFDKYQDIEKGKYIFLRHEKKLANTHYDIHHQDNIVEFLGVSLYIVIFNIGSKAAGNFLQT